MAHLRFLRWLIRTGRLDPDGSDDRNLSRANTGGLP
jgi:hypothetical protein